MTRSTQMYTSDWDRFGVFADGVQRTPSEQKQEFNKLLENLELCGTGSSPVQFSQKNRRWRVSAGADSAWFWIDALSTAFLLDEMPKSIQTVGGLLKELDASFRYRSETRHLEKISFEELGQLFYETRNNA